MKDTHNMRSRTKIILFLSIINPNDLQNLPNKGQTLTLFKNSIEKYELLMELENL